MAKKRTVPAGRHAKKRGNARMREFGYKEVKLYLDEKEAKAIDNASRKDGKRVSTWVREMIYLVATGPEYKKKGYPEP